MNEEQLRAQLNAVYSSTSWRITAPLRAVSRLVQVRGMSKAEVKVHIVSALRFLAKSAFVRRLGKRVLGYFPSLRNKVQSLLLQRTLPAPVIHITAEHVTTSLLSSETAAILKQIKMLRKEF